MLALYGDRLLCTHLDDNLGISRLDGQIYFTDDLHLLPFDGINDWQSIADRLNRHGYTGELTFEMGRGCAPGRHDKDKYNRMSIEEFLCEVYARACRVATLKNRGK
jgi:sugar phosphate isomerase/epimerase